MSSQITLVDDAVNSGDLTVEYDYESKRYRIWLDNKYIEVDASMFLGMLKAIQTNGEREGMIVR